MRMVALVKLLPVKNSRTAFTIQFRCCCLLTKKGVPIRIQFFVFITTTAGENDVAKVVAPIWHKMVVAGILHSRPKFKPAICTLIIEVLPQLVERSAGRMRVCHGSK